jgi:hypothetical protein
VSCIRPDRIPALGEINRSARSVFRIGESSRGEAPVERCLCQQKGLRGSTRSASSATVEACS